MIKRGIIGKINLTLKFMKKLLIVLPIVVLLATACASSQQTNNQTPVASSTNSQTQSFDTKEGVELTNVPSPMVLGKEYTIGWRAGKNISSVEVYLTSVDRLYGTQIYTTKSDQGSGTFQWKASDYNQSLEGWYRLEIVGRTAGYDAKASKIDPAIHKRPTAPELGLKEYESHLSTLESTGTWSWKDFAMLGKDLPEISSDSLSNVSSIDGFQIRYEFQTLPPGVAVGTNLKFMYKKHSAMVRSCVMNKDEQKNVFWCYIPWSSLLSDYSKKENWAIFIDNSTQGTAAERDQKRMKDIKQLATAIEAYKIKNGKYPCTNGECSDGSSIYQRANGNVIFPKFEGVHYEDPLGEKDKNFSYIYNSDAIGYEVYAQLENSFQDGDADFYCVDSLGAKKIISERPLSLSCESKLRPGEVYNKAYTCGYYTDNTSAYVNKSDGKITKLPGSDATTFHNVRNENSCIALDKNQIYMQDKVILHGADPATFEVLTNGNYARDKNHVYKIYPTPVIVEGADPKTFVSPQ